MAITATQSNHYKFQLGAKQIDLANDTIKPILMDNTFSLILMPMQHCQT